MVTARDVMTREVETCRPVDSLADVAQIMWKFDCGSVPVTDSAGKLVGIVTDRDLCMAAFTRGRRLDQMLVSSIAREEVESCREDTDVADIERLMAARQIRRLPVLDSEDRLVGIVSIGDLAVEASGSVPRLRDVAVTLARISWRRKALEAAAWRSDSRSLPLGGRGAPARREDGQGAGRGPSGPGWYAVRVPLPGGRELPRAFYCAEHDGEAACEVQPGAHALEPVEPFLEGAAFEGPFRSEEEAREALFPGALSGTPTAPPSSPTEPPPRIPPAF